MTEYLRPNGETDNLSGVAVSDLTQADVIAFSTFATTIVSDSPYSSDTEKERLRRSTTPEIFEQRLDDPTTVMVLAKDESGKMIGFGVGQAKVMEGAGEDPVGYMSWIGVDTSLRRVGVATAITSRMEDRFRAMGIKELVTFVKDANTASKTRILEKRGYTEHTGISPTLGGNTGGRFYRRPLV